MIAVYGDCYQAEIYDRKDKVRIGSMYGHEDYGFALEWHPTKPQIASGN